ncbi:oculocerebrorenal syndrome of lowe [Moniliophthora roreri]|nr:oculocerebrorenal syndrome of lowe [Moniliophthora roreri]
MAEYESALRLVLRDSDQIICIIQVFAIPETSKSADDDFENTLQDLRNKRILAVVTHREGGNAVEEGSVFVLKPKHSTNGYLDELDMRHIFPICDDFSVSMAQVKRPAQTLQSPARSHSSTPSVSLDKGLKLTLKAGLESSDEILHLFTYDVQGLKTVLAECRRLKEVSEQNTSGALPAQTFSWLATYTSRSINIPTLSKIPPDLRTETKPLHSRLSLASAGIPGDDADDILLIREGWVRSRARNTVRRGRARLSIRIGTFNVNGKMPSQDLAAWVRGSVESSSKSSSTLPPLKDISPLSMGEVAKNPIDQAVKASNISIETSSSTLRPDATEDRSFDPREPPILPVDPEYRDDPDILVFGFQELDLSTEALLYSTSTVREEAWCTAIFAALGEKRDLYEKLASKQLVGMLIVIMVKTSLRRCFSNVMTCATGVGIMGVMGNKGGTAIRLSFTPPPFGGLQLSSKEKPVVQKDVITSPGTTTVTFVCSHLAAFDEMVDKRNSDYHDLSRRLMFVESVAPNGASAATDNSGNATSQTSSTAPQLILERYNTRYSDLNYRIDLPDYDVRFMLAVEHWNKKYEMLLRYDQLTNAIKNNKAFDIFLEHPISHLPTYRFSPGLLSDDLGYDIKRKPAWTDRILYTHSHLTTRVRQNTYSCHSEITMSDHRPASADFTVEVDAYDDKELHATAKHLFRQLHGMEERQERSKARVSPSMIDFGDISYRKRVERSLTFQNNGNVPCAFRFVPIDTEGPIHPDWLSISPMTGLLLPNEVIEIVLCAFVDNDSASRLNLEPPNLDFTLILHTLMGKDHFVSVTAQYHYTCFANKLSRLTRLPGPIRSLKDPQDLLDETRGINAPREIMRLVNWMMTGNHSVASPLCVLPTLQLTNMQENIFMKEADEDIMYQIRECLDTGDEFSFSPNEKDDATLVAFGETLLQLLASLPEGVIPTALHNQCAQATNRDEAFEVRTISFCPTPLTQAKQILDALNPESVNVWISVTALLSHFVQSSAFSEMKAQRIAARFAPVLLRDDFRSPSPVSPLQRHRFLLQFIE